MTPSCLWSKDVGTIEDHDEDAFYIWSRLICAYYDDFEFQQSEFGNSTQTLNIDSGPMFSYYVEYIFLSAIVGHTVLFLGKGQCPLSTVRVIGCPVDDMTFATSPVNFIFYWI